MSAIGGKADITEARSRVDLGVTEYGCFLTRLDGRKSQLSMAHYGFRGDTGGDLRLLRGG